MSSTYKQKMMQYCMMMMLLMMFVMTKIRYGIMKIVFLDTSVFKYCLILIFKSLQYPHNVFAPICGFTDQSGYV